MVGVSEACDNGEGYMKISFGGFLRVPYVLSKLIYTAVIRIENFALNGDIYI
jgi:hypothetical protein